MPKYYIDKFDFYIIPLEKILKYIKAAPSLEIQAALSILYLCGCRLIEMCNLSTDDIYEQEDLIKIRLYTAKRGDKKRRILTFTKSTPLLSIILKHKKRTTTLTLFNYSKRTYQRRFLELNKLIYDTNTDMYITAHQLRHSRASYLAHTLSANTWEIKAWFGWKTSQPADVYVMENSSERFKDKIK